MRFLCLRWAFQANLETTMTARLEMTTGTALKYTKFVLDNTEYVLSLLSTLTLCYPIKRQTTSTKEPSQLDLVKPNRKARPVTRNMSSLQRM